MRATEKRKTSTARSKARAAEPKPRPKPRITPEQEKAYRELEHAVSLLYKEEYDRARSELKGMLEKYAQEREMLDRLRMYINVCEARSHRTPRGEGPDLYLQALVQYNEGEYEEALKILEKAARGDPGDARVTYLTACARLAHGEREEGLGLLREAIRMDTANRYRALNDPDLEEIRTAEDFLDAVGDEEPAS